MTKAMVNGDWGLCGKCRHKLFKIIDRGSIVILEDAKIEIKCHSCKELNVIDLKILDKAPQ